MNSLIRRLLHVHDRDAHRLGIIPWSSPVPAFGDFRKSKLATLGINPSNREFTCVANRELEGPSRRFPTLRSLGLERWAAAGPREQEAIITSCLAYFSGTPYNAWFGKLDSIIKGTGYSFYRTEAPACHLDLVPWATSKKWSYLDPANRRRLLMQGAPFLAEIINSSSIRVIVLNGRTVVNGLLGIAEHEGQFQRIKEWQLPRNSTSGVMGYAFEGVLYSIGGVALKNRIYYFGYNHNLQSSFGVTRAVQASIGNWIERKTIAYLENDENTAKHRLFRRPPGVRRTSKKPQRD